MSLHQIPLPDMVIANAGTNSNVLTSTEYRDADAITIHAPNTLVETVKVEVADNESPVAADWKDLRRSGANVTIAAGQSETLELISWLAMRLTADGAAAAERTFEVTKAVWA